MDKFTFISEISQPLKIMGYRKTKNYWYKDGNDIIYCINVQSSQWDELDYYVEIGIAVQSVHLKKPTILQWYCRHRCQGRKGEKNILPEDFFATLAAMFECISSVDDVDTLMRERRATKVVSQYWF